MSLNGKRLSNEIILAREATIKANQLLKEITRKQEALKGRVDALEHRMDSVMEIIRDTKAKWKVK